MWQDGKAKLLISHRSEYKHEVRIFAKALQEFGIHGFVAHEDITPTRAWTQTLISALDLMEALLAFITDGFCDSPWVNQEIGFALARQVLIIPLKLQNENPPAFISHIQAVTVGLARFTDAAPEIFRALSSLPIVHQMRQGLIEAFIDLRSYTDADLRLHRLEEGISSLTDEELNRIANGYANNDQLYGCYLVNRNDRFLNFLQQKTGRRYSIEGRIIRLQPPLSVL